MDQKPIYFFTRFRVRAFIRVRIHAIRIAMKGKSFLFYLLRVSLIIIALLNGKKTEGLKRFSTVSTSFTDET